MSNRQYVFNYLPTGGDSTGTSGVSLSWVEEAEVVSSAALGAIEARINNSKKEISPKLYFNYVKSKLSTLKQGELEHRLKKLHTLIEQCKKTGQKGLLEELVKLIAIAAREQEAYVYGIYKYTDKKTIDKFIDIVSPKIKFKPLDEFPRVIPPEAVEKIKNVREARLFDEYYVLYTDVTGEETLSTEKKIKAKDPILFGRYAYAKERWYFVCDWIDDHCDLTISKFIEKVGLFVEDIPEIDDRYLEVMKKHAMDSHTRIRDAKPSNYKKLAENAKGAFRRLFKRW